MIQTQLLRLDPPYQIISAGGQVGIQLATLIVTEEKTADDGQYVIDTHSHPVVSYGLKQGLEEIFKYGSRNPAEFSQHAMRLQPEGAVWNKVEVSDIRVLGLAGADNEQMSLEWFVSLVPTDSQFDPWERVWNEKSIAKMYDLFFGFSKVGIKCQSSTTPLTRNHDGDVIIHLHLDAPGSCTPLVKVEIRDDDEYDPSIGFVRFSVRLFDDDGEDRHIDKCVKNIMNAVRQLKGTFMQGERLHFVHRRLPVYVGNPLEEVVESVTNHVNGESEDWR
jgi:hypothetical protein